MGGNGSKVALRARITEFPYPPVHDALVLGRSAPLGTAAFRKALDLLIASPFETVTLDDDVIGSVLVRSAVLHRASQAKVVDFIVAQVKPLMSGDEILHLDIEVEVEVENEVRE